MQLLGFSRRRALLAALSLSLMPLLAGCPGSGGGSAGGGGGAGKVSGVLRYPLTANPTTLDPALVQDGPTIDMLQNMYEGLVGWNEKSEVVPLIAEKMPEISADGKTYTFKIRDGVKFHNGRAVTADDVVYSITRSLNKNINSPVALNYLNDIEGAEAFAKGQATEVKGLKAPDPKTVVITLVAPRAYFLGKLTYPTAYVIAKEEVDKGDKSPTGGNTLNEKTAIGTGPFKLSEYVPRSKAVLVANDAYWQGKPKLTKIERPVILDTKTARNLYDAGQLDYVNEEKSNYEADSQNPALKDEIKLWDRAATFYLGINQTNYAPFKNKKVRQAFAHAIDKDAIVKNVLLGVNQKAEGVLPKGIPGFDPNLKGLNYDPAKAKALLAEAGFPDGKGLPPLTLSFREQVSDLRKTAEVVKEQLAQIGVNVNLQEMEWAAYLKMNNDNKHDFFHMRWSADYIDAQNFLSLLLATGAPENHTGYSNPAYDALCKEADASTDPKKRLELYHKAEEIVVDDAPWVPLYFQKDMELMKPHVTGIRDSLMGHLPHITTEIK
ncbi:MAG: peptide ABC transporter substrate-binding protein [Armatimonas sp.]